MFGTRSQPATALLGDNSFYGEMAAPSPSYVTIARTPLTLTTPPLPFPMSEAMPVPKYEGPTPPILGSQKDEADNPEMMYETTRLDGGHHLPLPRDKTSKHDEENRRGHPSTLQKSGKKYDRTGDPYDHLASFKQAAHAERVSDTHTQVEGFGLMMEGKALSWL